MPTSLIVSLGKPPVVFLTEEELAKLCGRTKGTFIKYAKTGILPNPNFRKVGLVIKNGSRAGEQILGVKLYSKDKLAPQLISIFKGIKNGVKITDEQKMKIIAAFNEERYYYMNEY